MRKHEAVREIEIELRCKIYPGCETFTTIRIPEDTDASDLLKTIEAGCLMRNEQMPFSGDIRTIGCSIKSGKLQPGMYTVYGPRGIEDKIRERVRKYQQTERRD